ncbi:MAG: uroporphyrinogen decarboxylase [Coxiellaceae bacterium]|nr:uroporphyrinogen decarboxylase [Coxiellaceae bacterium]
MQNTRFIKALLRQSVDRAPIWLMRQAGRYLPEYRALRSKTRDFFTFCETPELACEATLQPLRRFPLDAAIIFSDILTIPRAMGCDIQMHENKGPFAPNPIRDAQAIQSLDTKVLEKLAYVSQAIQLTKKELNVPLIGFAGSPWTVATYMVEGGSSKTFEKIKSMMYKAPEMMHQLLQKITDATVDYLNAQIEAGADVVMLFDSWGGVLAPMEYQFFSLDYMKKIREKINNKNIPVIFFSKGCGLYLENIVQSGCDAVGVDWTMDLSVAKKIVNKRVALQGNLDPTILLSTPEVVASEAKKILNVYRGETGFIFNLGHGISKDTPVENVEMLVETISTYASRG